MTKLKEKYRHLIPEWEKADISQNENKYHLATYGCQMNVYDSNLIAEMMEKRGLKETSNPSDANVVIVNTCSIRGGAEDKAYARIASMRHHKKENPNLKIAVIGCMAQNHGEKIPVSLKHVDIVAGPDNYKELEKQLFEKQPEPAILTHQDHQENYNGLVAKVDSKVSTFVTIMRGCNKKCTYCIVPYVRGKERSRDPEEILIEIKRAVDQGVPEVTLLGQTVNSYYYSGVSFANLLKKINEIKGLKRIRFTSPHPRHFTRDVIDAMAECEKVCNHVHLPVQSGSNEILKKMRRQYTREKYFEIVAELREKMPNIGISTDIITGFAGETQKDYLDTLSLVEKVKFDSAFMFSYSPREGTYAFEERETLSNQEKSKRLQELIDLQNPITHSQTSKLIGMEKEILVEGPSHRNKSEWVGKTSCFKKVVFPKPEVINPGDFIQVNIDEIRGFTLAGKLVN